MSSHGSGKKTPKRKPKPEPNDLPPSFLPRQNLPAKWAYLCALIGIVPVLGVVMGVSAFFLGLLGRRKAKRNPDAGGFSHSLASIFLGLAQVIFNGLGIWLIGAHYHWW